MLEVIPLDSEKSNCIGNENDQTHISVQNAISTSITSNESPSRTSHFLLTSSYSAPERISDVEVIDHSEDVVHFCKLCMTSCKRKYLIAPCLCRGDRKWVHRNCLDKKRLFGGLRAFSMCLECLTSYQLVSLGTTNLFRIKTNSCVFF